MAHSCSPNGRCRTRMRWEARYRAHRGQRVSRFRPRALPRRAPGARPAAPEWRGRRAATLPTRRSGTNSTPPRSRSPIACHPPPITTVPCGYCLSERSPLAMPMTVRITGREALGHGELVDQSFDRQAHAEPSQHRLDPNAACEHEPPNSNRRSRRPHGKATVLRFDAKDRCHFLDAERLRRAALGGRRVQ